MPSPAQVEPTNALRYASPPLKLCTAAAGVEYRTVGAQLKRVCVKEA